MVKDQDESKWALGISGFFKKYLRNSKVTYTFE